jgi:hypothetical protein
LMAIARQALNAQNDAVLAVGMTFDAMIAGRTETAIAACALNPRRALRVI